MIFYAYKPILSCSNFKSGEVLASLDRENIFSFVGYDSGSRVERCDCSGARKFIVKEVNRISGNVSYYSLHPCNFVNCTVCERLKLFTAS